MSTSITRPWKDRRTPAEKQEAALVAAFRRMGPKGKFKLLRQSRAIVAKEEWQILNILRK